MHNHDENSTVVKHTQVTQHAPLSTCCSGNREANTEQHISSNRIQYTMIITYDISIKETTWDQTQSDSQTMGGFIKSATSQTNHSDMLVVQQHNGVTVQLASSKKRFLTERQLRWRLQYREEIARGIITGSSFRGGFRYLVVPHNTIWYAVCKHL